MSKDLHVRFVFDEAEPYIHAGDLIAFFGKGSEEAKAKGDEHAALMMLITSQVIQLLVYKQAELVG